MTKLMKQNRRQSVEGRIVSQEGLGQWMFVAGNHLDAASHQHNAGKPDSTGKLKYAFALDVETAHCLGKQLARWPKLAEQTPLRRGNMETLAMPLQVAELLLVAEDA